MMGIYAVIGGAIAAGVVYNAARISLTERGRELASLRVLGFTNNEVGYILLGELAIVALIGIPLGCIGGVALAHPDCNSHGNGTLSDSCYRERINAWHCGTNCPVVINDRSIVCSPEGPVAGPDRGTEDEGIEMPSVRIRIWIGLAVLTLLGFGWAFSPRAVEVDASYVTRG